MGSGVQKHTSTFTYSHKEITFHFWSHTDGRNPPDIVIFLGAGQVGSIPRWVATSATIGTVVVEGLPHWEAHPSASDIKEFSRLYIQCAFQAVLEAFGISSAHIIAESQAAPGAVLLTNILSSKVRNIALIRPLGFTVRVFGDSPESRLRTLKRRVLRTYFQFSQSPLYDPRNLLVMVILWRAMLSEKNRSALYKKYAAGVSYDLIPDCRRASIIQQRKGNTLTIFLGQEDRVFPPHEVISSLKEADIKNIKIVTLTGVSHSSLATRGDRKTLIQIIDTVRQ